MIKKMFMIAAVILVVLATASCAANINDGIITLDPIENGEYVILPAPADDPVGMPARPGSGVTGDPSANLPDFVEVSGTVKEVNPDLVLITCNDGSDFMLRFSENSKFVEGVNQEINVGNSISCTVKLEPTFTTPSQGEVFEVLVNIAAKLN
jgi:hypothetical protein